MGRYSFFSKTLRQHFGFLHIAKTKVLKKVWKSSFAEAAEDEKGGERLFLWFSQLVTAASYIEGNVRLSPKKVFFPSSTP